MPSSSRVRAAAPTIALTLVAAVGASVIGIVIEPHAGRAGAALVGAVVIAIVGTFRGLPAALAAALIEFLAFASFIGERRLPTDFDVGRHLPQLTLFLLVAVIAGGTASRLRIQAARLARRDAQLAALARAGDALAVAADLPAMARAVRTAGFETQFRLFAVDGGALREVEPLAEDDAGRAVEAAEVAWLTGCDLHRMAGVTAAPIRLGDDDDGAVLVSSAAVPLPPKLLESLAAMIRLASIRVDQPASSSASSTRDR